MHDPSTVAFDIKYPWRSRPTELFPEGRRGTFLTIWHRDPERDGSDDSCGWFKRAHHGDPVVLGTIRNEFQHALYAKTSGWFNADGTPRADPISITYGLFQTAAWVYFKRNRRKMDRFLRHHLADIINFATNPVDSLAAGLMNRYGVPEPADRVDSLASIIYGWIFRAEQRWWQHPRWHVHHWRFQLHPIQGLKRRWWDRCCRCGRRGFKGAAIGSWDGDAIWHAECDRAGAVPCTAPVAAHPS